jgi:hypothetical protein
MTSTLQTLTALAAAGLVAAAPTPARAVSVPSVIAAPAHESLTMSIGARGVQIYECRSRKDGSGNEWAFVGPEADLYDGDGRLVGQHGAGPHWRFEDGSRITGRVKARADAPQSQAIPWLLLDARARWPQDRFAHVRSIQRVNTVGGTAPAEGCHASQLGSALRVPYTAVYHFYGSR